MGDQQTAPADSTTRDFPRLPAGFTFGTSTASYQIEGAVTEGGRGPSIWDTFTAEPGRIVDGSSGAVACDHYHRVGEDVALMRRLGVQGYRFSVSWSRIQPSGAGPANAAGLAFYDRLLDELAAADIAPMLTLFHWDLPQALQDEGGWLNRDVTDRFADYAAILADRFADRVAKWVPINEPNVHTVLGHALGQHAPGQALGFDCLPVAHHLNLAHGRAVQALRAGGAREIGTATNHQPMWAASEEQADIDAAALLDSIWNGLFAGPMLLGEYPEGFAEAMPGPVAEDLAVIRQPLDFYGMNYYNPMLVGAAAEGAELPFEIGEVEGYPTTDFGWPIVPQGLRQMLNQLHDQYPDIPPIHITENGCSSAVGPDEQGVVADQMRIDYLDSHLRAVGQAIEDGVDIRGYYCWSTMDNFEWAEGFTQRFGLVHIDYDTLVRTPKNSFHWYADLVRANS